MRFADIAEPMIPSPIIPTVCCFIAPSFSVDPPANTLPFSLKKGGGVAGAVFSLPCGGGAGGLLVALGPLPRRGGRPCPYRPPHPPGACPQIHARAPGGVG